MVKSIPIQNSKTSKRQVVKDLTGLEHWTHRGTEDVYYQRESCTTWWTILGGVAVAALLTRLETVWGLVLSGDWYYLLYVVATALVILLAWLQVSWGALVVRWRISLDNVMWIYLSGLSLSFVSLSVSNIPIWWLALTVLVVVSIANQLYFHRSGAWVTFPKVAIQRILKGLWIYAIFTGITLAGFISISLYPIKPLEIGFGIVALLGSLVALLQQNADMNYERTLYKIP
jgi:hypothetical protein